MTNDDQPAPTAPDTQQELNEETVADLEAGTDVQGGRPPQPVETGPHRCYSHPYCPPEGPPHPPTVYCE